jgi:hypothetical protein
MLVNRPEDRTGPPVIPPPELLTADQLRQLLADARAAVRVYSDPLKIAERASRRRTRPVAVPVRKREGVARARQ